MTRFEGKEELDFGRFIGTSPAMLEVYEKIISLSGCDYSVFIGGESGTGKEICAQALHYYSDRKDKPFITINCAGLSKEAIDSQLFGHIKGAYTGATQARLGAVHKAEGGTLFLDEIGDMPYDLQLKLLRFCQDLTYSKLGSDNVLRADVRLISASNANLRQRVVQGQFREDLLYRLYETDIQIPALRERPEDILTIAHYFIAKYAKEQNKHIKSFSENAEQTMHDYHWPGNVRELQNLMRKIIFMDKTHIILTSMLEPYLSISALTSVTKIPNTQSIPQTPL